MKILEFDTPSLVIDIVKAEQNIQTMRDFFSSKKCTLRAHTKIHKSPYLAQLEIAGGSKGITCAKLGEAEVMAQAGISDILIANEIVGTYKTRRLARLAKYCNLKVAVDDLENAKEISKEASEFGSTVGLIVDVNLSGGGTSGKNRLPGILDRCGVPSGKLAAELTKGLIRLPSIKFMGVMGYEGGLPDSSNIENSNLITREALERLVEARDLIEDDGTHVEIVSCGSSTSYKVASQISGITEIQAGSYILMDTYHHQFSPEFNYALWVQAQVISKPKPDRAILDAGGNAISADAGLPEIREGVGMKLIELNAEHTHVKTDEGVRLTRGDRLDLLPSNIDTTTCLHDYYVVSRHGEIEMKLPVAARGKFQ